MRADRSDSLSGARSAGSVRSGSNIRRRLEGRLWGKVLHGSTTYAVWYNTGVAIIECVPNVSEGRRPAVVETLLEAVRSVRGVRVLDASSDPAHNRSVFTMTGDAAPLKAAVLALAGAAVEHIDLRTHTGEHPRLGAVDVVPFVPIEGVTMAECVELAKDAAAEVATR